MSTLERDQHVAEWIRLTEEAGAKRQEKHEADFSQSAKKSKPGRKSGGVHAASKELGIDKDDARRAVKVSSLTEEAKAISVRSTPKLDPTAAERNRRYRKRKREGFRVLRGGLAIDETTLAILVQREIIDAAVTDRDEILLKEISDVLDLIAR